jgi:hypothetical protein
MSYVVIRHYQDAGALIDGLAQREDDIQRLIRGIPGFVAYNLVRSEGGGFSVSVFDDRKGADESVQVARDYVRENFADVGVAPQVIEGEAVISFTAS